MSEYLDLQNELREIEAERPSKRLPDPGDLSVHDWAYETAQRRHSASDTAPIETALRHGQTDMTPEEIVLFRKYSS